MAGHDRYTAEGKRFIRELEELKKLCVRVGYQDDGTMAAVRMPDGSIAESDEVTLLDIAMWNELGTSNAPSRPFLRKSFDMNEDKVRAFAAEQIKKLTHGATAKQVLEAIGVFQKALVQDAILNGGFDANEQSTVKKKGSAKPLIDTGRLRQSTNFVITQKGGD